MQRTGNFTSQGVSYVSSTSSLCAANSASASGGRIILYYTIGPRLDLARAAGGNIPPDFRRRGIAILRRTPSASSSSSASPGHGCTGLFFRGNTRHCPARDTRQSPTVSTVGKRFRQTDKSRQGRQTPTNAGIERRLSRSHRSHRASFCRPCRGCGRERLVVPPLKRWAIVGCSWRDKE